MSPELLGAWVAAGLTLAIFSFLYKDNPFFKFGEHLYIGISVGYSITLLVFNFMIPKWWTPLFREGRMSLLVPTALGLLIWTRFFPRFSWLSRWAFAFVVGFGAGIAIPRTISNFIFRQVESTAVPLVSRGQQGVSFGWGDFSNFLIAFGVLSVLTFSEGCTTWWSILPGGTVTLPWYFWALWSPCSWRRPCRRSGRADDRK